MLRIFAPFCCYKNATKNFCMKNYTPHQFYATENGRFFASRFESFRWIQHISLWVGRVGKKRAKNEWGRGSRMNVILTTTPVLDFHQSTGRFTSFCLQFALVVVCNFIATTHFFSWRWAFIFEGTPAIVLTVLFRKAMFVSRTFHQVTDAWKDMEKIN